MGNPEDKESQLPLIRTSHSRTISQSSESSLSAESAFLGDDDKAMDLKLNGSSNNNNTETAAELAGGQRYRDLEDAEAGSNEPFLTPSARKKASTKAGLTRRIIWILGFLCVGGWVLAFVLFLVRPRTPYNIAAEVYEPESATGATSYGKPVSLESVLTGQWSAKSHAVSWIAGPNGEDGLLVQRGEDDGQGYLRLDDIRDRKGGGAKGKVLMEKHVVQVNGNPVVPTDTWPSSDLKKVLIISEKQKNWRHSYTGKYWIFDVVSQTAQPLDPSNVDGRVQLAAWAPTSDAVIFVRDNNLYLRQLSSNSVIAITTDGGQDLFYGVPDWVYEEEVLSDRIASWWSSNGKYVAFFRTNESSVPDYPVQYFLSRPSGKKPLPGLENYPEVRQIKYPKAGAPNPVVDLQFYDVEKDQVFSINMSDDFADNDRIIVEVLWASDANVLVRASNRESDIVKIFLIDTKARTGKLVRNENIAKLDGGWVEPSQTTRFVPADPSNGRPHDGYVDTIIHDGHDHLAYFTPLDNPDPIMLTSGEWEVVKAPSAVDLQRGLVYFVATKEAPTQRHVYRVKLDGSSFQPLTDVSKPGYFEVSFSCGAGYALVSYLGPSVPWQAIMNTQGDQAKYEETIEDNPDLTRMVEEYALPAEVYQNVTIDGYTLQVVERRPPHFNPAKKYPVLFYLYGGPGSQTVDRKFNIDWQSYVASSLGYIVVTVDGRGTGFIGRKARCIIRGNIGHYEAIDQIESAKIWAKKPYVDETRMAIWGWSYGGFMTLKTLERDAGQTFQYGMAVAPVTDWRFYDSVYTERYMHTPQHNPDGYDNATITDTTALESTVRFFIQHGVSDDNVHLQNTLVLIDKLDVANVQNYDLLFYPDSDHSIFFHNGHRVVYERMSTWLINAFNGEWHHIASPVPDESVFKRVRRSLLSLFS